MKNDINEGTTTVRNKSSNSVADRDNVGHSKRNEMGAGGKLRDRQPCLQWEGILTERGEGERERRDGIGPSATSNHSYVAMASNASTASRCYGHPAGRVSTGDGGSLRDSQGREGEDRRASDRELALSLFDEVLDQNAIPTIRQHSE